jgi:hypothetical protein
MQQHAFVDESHRSGRYLLTAVLVQSRDLASTTRAVRAAVPKGQQRIHFCTERPAARRAILDAFARLEVTAHVVVAPYRGGDDQRARDVCLRGLLGHLETWSVGVLVFDSRQPHRDHLDRIVIAEAIRVGRVREELHYSHRGSRDEPLLGLPDAIGWAYGAGGESRRRVQPILGSVLSVE